MLVIKSRELYFRTFFFCLRQNDWFSFNPHILLIAQITPFISVSIGSLCDLRFHSGLSWKNCHQKAIQFAQIRLDFLTYNYYGS